MSIPLISKYIQYIFCDNSMGLHVFHGMQLNIDPGITHIHIHTTIQHARGLIMKRFKNVLDVQIYWHMICQGLLVVTNVNYACNTFAVSKQMKRS